MPLISVIVPNYNHSAYLKQRIDSILKQTYQDFELILLDDASTDKSREIIESYRANERVAHIVYNETNSGIPFKQWQKGLEAASGEYIWIAESDDNCEQTFLEELIRIHQTHNVGIAYCKSLPINDKNIVYDYSDWWMKRVDPEKWESDYVNDGINECENFLATQCTIPNASAVVFKTAAIRNINVGAITLRVCGDWLIYAKILETNAIAYTSKPLNFHRNHAQNARSLHQHGILTEQLSVMSFIAKRFKINKKTRHFKKSLEEKIASFISALKKRQLPIKDITLILSALFFLDRFVVFRLFTILSLKMLGRTKPFH